MPAVREGNYSRFRIEFAGDTPQDLVEQMLGYLMAIGAIKKPEKKEGEKEHE